VHLLVNELCESANNFVNIINEDTLKILLLNCLNVLYFLKMPITS